MALVLTFHLVLIPYLTLACLLFPFSDFVDVNIGYQFVNILYRDSADSTLGVDIDLINDVREQDGGGGEPLMEEDDL